MKPFSLFRIVFEILRHQLNAKGPHQLHSPFAFKFYNQVVKASRKRNSLFDLVREESEKLKRSPEKLQFTDPSSSKPVHTTVGQLALKSAKNHHLGKLLGLAMDFLKPNHALELGTSLGISAAYQTVLHQPDFFKSIEANTQLAPYARELWQSTKSKVELIQGYFDEHLPEKLHKESFDWIFIDGNHQYDATIRYFQYILENTKDDCVIIFDDINWSEDMQRAWREITQSECTKLCLDLFFIGFVFRNPGLSKETFKLRL